MFKNNLVEVMRWYFDSKQSNEISLYHIDKFLKKNLATQSSSVCNASLNIIAIDSDGSIYPCLGLLIQKKEKLGNILDESEKYYAKSALIRGALSRLASLNKKYFLCPAHVKTGFSKNLCTNSSEDIPFETKIFIDAYNEV